MPINDNVSKIIKSLVIFKKSFEPCNFPWHYIGAPGEPAFLSGWLNYGSLPSWVPARFMKDALGFVHVEAMVRAGASNTSLFQLPIGYRPNATVVFPIICNNMATTALGKVAPDGNVGNEGLAGNTWVVFKVSFKAEQ